MRVSAVPQKTPFGSFAKKSTIRPGPRRGLNNNHSEDIRGFCPVYKDGKALTLPDLSDIFGNFAVFSNLQKEAIPYIFFL